MWNICCLVVCPQVLVWLPDAAVGTADAAAADVDVCLCVCYEKWPRVQPWCWLRRAIVVVCIWCACVLKLVPMSANISFQLFQTQRQTQCCY